MHCDDFRPPLTLGSAGDFVVAGAGCLPVHARIYFDGATLFAASIDLGHPVLVNHAPLGLDWSEVPCPSIIDLGSSRLVYEGAGDSQAEPAPSRDRGEALTRVQSREALSSILSDERHQARSRGPAPDDSWDGRTPHRVAKVDALEAPTVVGPAPSPVASTVTRRYDEAPAGDHPLAATTDRGRTDDTARRLRKGTLLRLFERVRDDFRRTPVRSRLLFLGLPVFAWGALTFARPPDADTERAAQPVAAALSDTPAGPARTATAQRSLPPSAVPPPIPSASTVAVYPAGPAPSGTLAEKRTLEARAADAAARGAFSEAASLYERLAELHPERSEFASAARILRAKHTESP
jgi:hypothetical protein